MKRKVLALFLALLLIVPCYSALADSYVMAGFDGSSSTRIWKENSFFTRMEALTGISFTFQQYSSSSEWTAAKEAMLSGQAELPDVLFKAALTDDELIRGLDSGVLIDLAPLLEENAPHLWAVLQENPDWLAAITLPDGRIGALPALTEMVTQDAMWINQEWLDKLHLDMPTDLESLRTVLTAFRDKDPNGNGKKDEIPMAFLGPWELKFFSHAYGIVVNNYNLYQDDEGQLHYWPMEDSFVELAKVLREFYRDGLLDSTGFTTGDSLRAISDSDADLTYGAFFAPSPLNLVTTDMAKEFVLLPPLEYEGKQVYRDLEQDCVTGTFAITSKCADPAAMLRWVDNLYTEEGAILAMVGTEGEYWEKNEDGKWSYVSSISTTDLDGLSVYDSGAMPWLFPKDFYVNFSDLELARLSEALDVLQTYARKPTDRAVFTGEDKQRLLALQNELGTYVDTTFARWILGQEEINETTVAAFRQGLTERGAEELVSLWQSHMNNK